MPAHASPLRHLLLLLLILLCVRFGRSRCSAATMRTGVGGLAGGLELVRGSVQEPGLLFCQRDYCSPKTGHGVVHSAHITVKLRPHGSEVLVCHIPLEPHVQTKTLTRSLDSRRSSSNSKKGLAPTGAPGQTSIDTSTGQVRANTAGLTSDVRDEGMEGSHSQATHPTIGKSVAVGHP